MSVSASPAGPPASAPPPSGTDPVLNRENWRAAGAALLARTVAELAYEEMAVPVPDGGPGRWRLDLDGGVTYRFTARRAAFGAWRVDPSSLVRTAGGAEEPACDPRRFVLDARSAIGLPGDVLADVVRDITATQTADARLRASLPTAAELAELSHEDLEAHQTGHPCMFLNKGRTGFSAADAERYTPEARGDFRLEWIAVAPDLGGFQAVPGLDRHRLLAEELDPATRAAFAAAVRAAGADPDAYLWLPVHPFQWDEVVRPLFAAEIAEGRLVHLGQSPDRYRPLQSVRTLTNLDKPSRRNVKVPLMIRNTLVWRGLSATQTRCAPHTTAWLRELADGDPFLREECRVAMLAESASVTVPHPAFAEAPDAPYRYHELLGAIWREPVHNYLEPGERARTMAALLTEGSDGRAFAAELVARSGLDAHAWLRAFLHALLPPVLHYLYRYGASFTPHGENVVLVFDRREVPVRIALKDFGSDVELLPFDLPEYARLPEHVRAVLHRWQPGELAHSVLSAICAGHFRYFTDIAERHLGVPEDAFWALVREEITAYHGRFPELSERFAWFDLLAPVIDRVALNREQLIGGGFHDRAERDAQFDVMYGKVVNPLHRPEPGTAPAGPPEAPEGGRA
ncbi:IucA/IucC family protein [Allonocardiopsis opalescens]|uniref:Siderophore synthetase component n=1 Tax=Allonocardiopsis opalescens TaxID=1144618 RepID=A0A2T0QE06_9ACTN|nr:IucA/IucC family protein [Allonocardiopsis opalescens]PRY02174.1 siderophore synthetase component [Allonocardiopsis opalescens]